MRGLIIGLIFIAVAIAGGTAFLLRSYLSDQEAELKAKQETKLVEEVYVLVAKKNLPVGHTITGKNIKDSLAWQGWPATAVAGNYRMERQPGKDVRKEYVGLTVREPLAKREPITPSKLFKKGPGGYLAGVLGPGMRSVTIGVNEESAAQGFIKPGDRVDVMLYWELTNQARGTLVGAGGQRLIDKRAAEVILRDVKVLAVNTTLAEETGGDKKKKKNKKPKHIALEVTPKGAEILEVARNIGDLSLILRSLARDETEPPAGPDSRNALSFTTDYEVSPLMSNLPEALRILSNRIAGPDGFGGSDVAPAGPQNDASIELDGAADTGGNTNRGRGDATGVIPDPVVIERVVEIERRPGSSEPRTASAAPGPSTAPIRVYRGGSGSSDAEPTPVADDTVEVTEEEINNPDAERTPRDDL